MSAPPLERERARALVAHLLRVDGAAARTPADDDALLPWDVALAEAGRPLLPMLAFACDRYGVRPPTPIRATLDAARRGAALVLTRRRALMRQLLPALDAAGIDAVVLKGFALAHQVYPAPELRVMNDLDVWVDETRLVEAEAALRPLGWRVHWRHAPLAEQVAHGVVQLSTGDPLQLLEVHARPASLHESVPDEVPAIWSRRRRTRLGDIDALVLAPEDQLLHACVHVARHHHFIGALPRLLDVSLMVANAGDHFDWPALALRARRAGAAGWVAVTLAAAQQQFAAPVPADALARFGIREADDLARLACAQAWAVYEAGVFPTSLLARPTWTSKISGFASRLRDVLVGSGRGDLPGDLPSRLRLLSRSAGPGFARALVRVIQGRRPDDAIAQLQRDNRVLAAQMAQAGESARLGS